MYKKTTLPNGLRIITVPQEQSQTATVLVLVGTGSKYEKKEISGVSHFLEHMLLKGTAKRPTEMDVFGAIDEVGGAFNAFTGEDFTGYYAKVQSSKFEFALDWVSDIFLRSTLPAEEIEKDFAKSLGKNVDMANKNALNEIGKKYILPEVKYV